MVDGGTEGIPLKCVAADYPRCETATMWMQRHPPQRRLIAAHEILVLASSIITFVAT